MSRELQAPTVKDRGQWGKEATHPAFGSIVLTRWSRGPCGSNLFGSELRHRDGMSIEIHEATHVRSLNSDTVHPGKIIAKVDLSLAQWAQFVSSQGVGCGTPCTLRYYRDGEFVDVPGIAPPENHLKKFKVEMQKAIDERTEKINEALDELIKMVEEGKLGKRDLREKLKNAKLHAENLPGSVDFVNKQFAESIETITQAAKTEVEGYVAGMAMRTGIQALRDAAPKMDMIENGSAE
jgi:hypothetical protein